MPDNEKNILFGEYYRELFEKFGEIIKNSIFQVFEKDIKEYWNEVYENASKQSHTSHPVKNGNFFFKNITEALKISNKTPLPKEEKELFENFLELPVETQKDSFDIVEYLKQICYCSNNNTIFKKYYNINYQDFDANIRFCISYRNNAIGHLTNLNQDKYYNIEEFSKFVSILQKTLKYCNGPKPSSEIKSMYTKFLGCCEELQEKAGYKPIRIEELAQQQDICVDDIINCCLKYNFKHDEKYIFGVSERNIINSLHEFDRQKSNKTQNEIISILNEKLNDFDRVSKEQEENIQKILNVSEQCLSYLAKVPTETTAEYISEAVNNAKNTEQAANRFVNKIKDDLKLDNLKYLPSYNRGFLNTEQLDEMLLKYNIIADTSAFMVSSSRAFITNVLIPFKLKNVKKSTPLAMHRASRNEIYDLATMSFDEMDVDEETIEIKKSAKKALLTIRELRKRGHLTIIGKDSFDKSSSDLLLSMMSSRINKRFCVITQEQSFAEMLAKTNIRTLCAMKIAGERPLVWSVIADNLKYDHNQFIKEYLYHKLNCDVKLVTDDTNASVHLKQETPESISKITIDNKTITEQKDLDIGKQKTANEQNSVALASDNKKFNSDIKLLTTGDFVYDSRGNKIKLINQLGSGGEGIVYETSQHSIVAKIYHLKNRSQNNWLKLEKMISNRIESKEIIWPIDILYNENHDYVGFIMSRTPSNCKQLGETVLKINNSNIQKQLLPNWKRLDLVNVCYQITLVFKILHSHDILMGDINPANILINPSNPSEIYFVDCDSYQVGDYLCPVGTPVFTSPEYYKKCNMKPRYSKVKRTIEDEYYALAAFIFEVLMNGQAPFASKSDEKKNIIDDICNYRFAFKTKETSGADVPDGNFKMIWNNMDNSCKKKFADVFEGRKRYTADEWSRSLYYYSKQIMEGKSSNDLFPTKYVDTTGSFIDFTCKCCGVESNMHKDLYEKIIRTHPENPIFLCNRCKAVMNDSLPDIVSCDRCGTTFHPTVGEKWRHDMFNFNYKCEKCKNGRK